MHNVLRYSVQIAILVVSWRLIRKEWDRDPPNTCCLDRRLSILNRIRGKLCRFSIRRRPNSIGWTN